MAFGYEVHTEVDKDSDLAHTVRITSANIHDVTMVTDPVPARKTADTRASKNGKTPFFSMSKGNGFVTESTSATPRVNMQAIVLACRSSAANGRNLLYGPK